jgi:hypothetical protein
VSPNPLGERSTHKTPGEYSGSISTGGKKLLRRIIKNCVGGIKLDLAEDHCIDAVHNRSLFTTVKKEAPYSSETPVKSTRLYVIIFRNALIFIIIGVQI